MTDSRIQATVGKDTEEQEREAHKTDNGTDKRLCMNCETGIDYKRSDAKFCGDKCRREYHSFKLKD